MTSFSGGKTTFFGIIFALATLIMSNPDMLGDLPNSSQAWIRTIAGVIVAMSGVLGFAAAKNNPSPAQTQAKIVAQEMDKQDLKAEIKQELIVEIPKAIEIKEYEE